MLRFWLLRDRKPVHKEVGKGEFACRHCREKTAYRQVDVIQRKAFCFFVFEGVTTEAHVECQKCRRKMPVEDLRGRMPDDAKQVLAAVKAKLETGEAIEEIIANLTQAGMPEREAHRMVNACVGITSKKCPQCSLRFLGSVLSCKKCGHTLPQR